MEQMSLFDFLKELEEPQPTASVIKAPAVEVVPGNIADAAPFDGFPFDRKPISRSYSLAVYKGDGNYVFTLTLPVSNGSDIEYIKNALRSAGIDPAVSWHQQMGALKDMATRETYTANELRPYRYGLAGNIKGRYAVCPYCPECCEETGIVQVTDGTAEYSCGHMSPAVEIVLPYYTYAQTLFELIN